MATYSLVRSQVSTRSRPLPRPKAILIWMVGFFIVAETCASSGLYFEVSPTQGISQAMNALFRKAIADARISS